MQFPLLIQLINGQLSFSEVSLNQWSVIIQQARHGMVLGFLYYKLEPFIQDGTVPEEINKHLISAKIHAEKQLNDLNWEVKHLREIAEVNQTPLVLLKGSAYAVQRNQASKGRIFSDIDLLVPKSEIPRTEKLLMLNGWLPTKHDEYDQHYYRKWMHEIPPLVHIKRRSVIDLHHNILPLTSAASPDPELLLDCSIETKDTAMIKVLNPLDMIIHSAGHLFYDGELEHGCRDLVDLDALIRENCSSGNEIFVDSLITRSQQLGLERAVFYALRYVRMILRGSIYYNNEANKQIGSPGFWQLKLMDFMFLRALMPDHKSCNDFFTPLARFYLYLRSHFLKMPVSILIPHLFRKSKLRLLASFTSIKK